MSGLSHQESRAGFRKQGSLAGGSREVSQRRFTIGAIPVPWRQRTLDERPDGNFRRAEPLSPSTYQPAQHETPLRLINLNRHFPNVAAVNLEADFPDAGAKFVRSLQYEIVLSSRIDSLGYPRAI